MQSHEYDTMFEREQGHWWFRGTRRVIIRVAQQALRPPGLENPRVVDVGCGTGGTLLAIPSTWQALGVEPEERGVRHCQSRGLAVVQGSATQLPLSAASFDLALALDVIEHIDDDGAAMSELSRVVRPGGAVVVTVPAHPFLWSEHDEALHHVRRYRKRELVALFERSPLQLEWLSYYNTALFPVVATVRLARSAMRRVGLLRSLAPPRSDVALPPDPVNRALTALVAAEAHWLPEHSLPWGVSLIAVGRVP